MDRDNLRDLLGIRLKFSGVTKEADERVDESVTRWFGHIEKMKKDKIAKRVYGRVCR